MKKTFSSKKSAFSLIELSIVLIIIGLLIAGITGGASLIKSSELRSVMGEARGYSVAVNAFYTQFNALPGDFDTAVGSESTYIGDNDGNIEYARDYDAIPGSEGTVAWYALKTIGAIDDTLTYAASSTAQVPGTNIPASKIKSGGWVFDYVTAFSQNVVILTNTTTATTGDGDQAPAYVEGVLLPTDALSIDSKIDDGVANAGKIRGVEPTGNACTTTAAYTVATATKDCALSYQVDVNS